MNVVDTARELLAGSFYELKGSFDEIVDVYHRQILILFDVTGIGGRLLAGGVMHLLEGLIEHVYGVVASATVGPVT